MNRRTFVSAAAAFAASPLIGTAAPARKLRVLFLGGTYFLGPSFVDALLARGHSVTLFNRGLTNPQLFPHLEKLRGDRYPERGNGLRALEGTRTWDVVVDTCAPLPRVLQASLDVLAGRVGCYCFISTIAVYRDFSVTNIMETAALRPEKWTPGDENITDANYPGRKAWMEQTLSTARFPTLIVRPGVITGPRNDDDSGRYWATRVVRGGRFLAPGDGDDPLQFIDARDLSAWGTVMLERGVTGTFNAAGPTAGVTTFRTYLNALRTTLNPSAIPRWTDVSFLVANGLTHKELPFFNSRNGVNRGWQAVNVEKALANGLAFRSLAEIARDEYAWQTSHFPASYDFGKTRGLSAQREALLLQAAG